MGPPPVPPVDELLVDVEVDVDVELVLVLVLVCVDVEVDVPPMLLEVVVPPVPPAPPARSCGPYSVERDPHAAIPSAASAAERCEKRRRFMRASLLHLRLLRASCRQNPASAAIRESPPPPP